MEFEELQHIWDIQNKESIYAINEKAMHNLILAKKNKAGHIANFSEIILVVTNIGVACFITAIDLVNENVDIYTYLMAALTFFTGLYVWIISARRRKTENRFDRSMLGDLEHALATATYQVRLSGAMRWFFLPPFCILALLRVWSSQTSVWMLAPILLLFVLAHFGGRWEHNIYKSRKNELEVLRKKLMREDHL